MKNKKPIGRECVVCAGGDNHKFTPSVSSIFLFEFIYFSFLFKCFRTFKNNQMNRLHISQKQGHENVYIRSSNRNY